MIAVFCAEPRDLLEIEFTPIKIFKRINSMYDLRGMRFTGIIKLKGWNRHANKEIEDAYDYLSKIQPELFI